MATKAELQERIDELEAQEPAAIDPKVFALLDAIISKGTVAADMARQVKALLR